MATATPPGDLEPRLREAEISGARAPQPSPSAPPAAQPHRPTIPRRPTARDRRLDERLKTLATREDVSSVKVWFVVTSVALVALVATVAGAIVAG